MNYLRQVRLQVLDDPALVQIQTDEVAEVEVLDLIMTVGDLLVAEAAEVVEEVDKYFYPFFLNGFFPLSKNFTKKGNPKPCTTNIIVTTTTVRKIILSL